MKQENKFVAQLFHFLAPFVDMSKDLFICIDGGAAKHHAGLEFGPLLDPDVPDLWFSLVGHDYPTGIEAKIIEDHYISVRRGQLLAWRTQGTGAYQPRFWVASNRNLSEFYCWHHEDVRSKLDESKSSVDNIKLSLKKIPVGYRSDNLPGLALYILSHAKTSLPIYN